MVDKPASIENTAQVSATNTQQEGGGDCTEGFKSGSTDLQNSPVKPFYGKSAGNQFRNSSNGGSPPRDTKRQSMQSWLKKQDKNSRAPKATSSHNNARKKIPKLPDVALPARINDKSRIVSQRKSTELKFKTYMKEFGENRVVDGVINKPVYASSVEPDERGTIVLQNDSISSGPDRKSVV